VSTPETPAPARPELSADERRWLHDKFERLSQEEGQLASTRTTYFATIGAVLITGLIVAVTNAAVHPELLVVAVAFLAGFGILFSTVWALLLHRTADAQRLWRTAALQLEALAPPVRTEVRAVIPAGGASRIEVDLARPYTVHALRFAPDRSIAAIDRIDPWRLSEIMPLTFIAVWAGTLVIAVVWYVALR